MRKFSCMMMSTAISNAHNLKGVMLTVDSAHDEPDLGGIGRAREVGVDLLRLGLVQRHESVENVIAGRSIVRATCRRSVSRGPDLTGQLTLVVREIVLHRADWQLFLESIDLVEKKDDAGLDEPPRVADAVEKSDYGQSGE
jgi:hypothetical protein